MRDRSLPSGRASDKVNTGLSKAPQPHDKPNRHEHVQRREQVYQLRVQYLMTYESIEEHFAKLTPPIRISRWTIQKYIEQQAEIEGKAINRGRRRHIATAALAQFDHVYRQAHRIALAPDTTHRDKISALALIEKTINDKITFLQSLGIVDKTLGVLILGTEGVVKDEKIPDGVEQRRWFENVQVTEGEIISEAERAIRYGEHAALPPAGDRVSVDAGSGDGA